MTAAGPPSEEVLDSADPAGRTPVPRSRRVAGALVVVAVVAAGLFAFQALQPDPVSDRADPGPTTSTATDAPPDPALVDDSAERISGDTGIGGAQTFSTAIRAATAVVRQLCRNDIPSWAATLVTSADSYEEATFLMTPAGRENGTFFVQVELTWSVDHYLYAAVAGHVERCS